MKSPWVLAPTTGLPADFGGLLAPCSAGGSYANGDRRSHNEKIRMGQAINQPTNQPWLLDGYIITYDLLWFTKGL